MLYSLVADRCSCGPAVRAVDGVGDGGGGGHDEEDLGEHLQGLVVGLR